MTEGPRLSLKAIAEQAVRAKNETQAATTQPPLIATPIEARPAAQQAATPAPHATKQQPRQPPSTNLLLPAALIAAISAALAGGVVWWLAQPPAQQPAPPAAAEGSISSAAIATAPVASASANTAPGLGGAPAGATAMATPSAVPTTSLTDLPSASSAAPPTTERGAPKSKAAKSAQLSDTEIAKTLANAAGGPVLAGSGPSGSIPSGPGPNGHVEGRSLQQTPETQAEPADLTPSSGAVQAAVGSVLGSARTCVAGDREASRARIVFASSGAVSAVTVSGPAARTPAEACIKAALSKARVAPFQKPNYSVDTTIRP